MEIKPSGGSRLKTKPPGENHNENKLDVLAFTIRLRRSAQSKTKATPHYPGLPRNKRLQ